MKKNYVLDTCVLIHDPEALFNFENNNVYIPFTVLEEIDGLKKGDGEAGRNARHTARYLDEIRKKGILTEGIELENGTTLHVIKDDHEDYLDIDRNKNDNRILMTAYNIQQSDKEIETIFVTDDVGLRVKADVLGLPSEYYGKKKKFIDYKGVSKLILPGDRFAEFKKNGWVSADETPLIMSNEYLYVDNMVTGARSVARYYGAEGKYKKLIPMQQNGVFGLRPRSEEQHFAFDALLDPDIKLVTLSGQAGTGKTLLALAAGLEQIVNSNLYSKLLICRPVEPMGRDIGFLPGTLEEKLSPWMQPINDSLEFLFGLHKRHIHTKGRKNSPKKQARPKTDEKPLTLHEKLVKQGVLQVEALTYIRGRSIPNQFIIIDEAQNLSIHEIKTIITRAGEGTKIVLTGDTQQIDSPYLNETNNGLSYCIDKMKEENISAHVSLIRGERSDLAEIASKKL